ncbi:MAG: formate dehydrogenase subunit gamma [Candidatus Kryptoniota bacterium]
METRNLHTDKVEFVRFSLNQRVQHFLLVLSFTLLAFTGIPLKFPGTTWVLLGFNIGVARIIHRISAVILISVSVYHIFYLFGLLIKNKFRVRETFTMLPSMKDLHDFLETTRNYFGLRSDLPMYDRYSFREKFEYWALAWGTVVMIVSGLTLWFNVAIGNIMPDWWIVAAYIAHSWEAWLAILAIIIWHMYNAHFAPGKFPMSNVWLTGKISEEEMIIEHPLEYERITGRKVDPQFRLELLKGQKWIRRKEGNHPVTEESIEA